MSVTVTITVKGSGQVEVYRNGSFLGVVPSNQSKPFTFEIGDIFWFMASRMTEAITFVKWVNANGEATATNPFEGVIGSGGGLTAEFSDAPKGMSTTNIILLFAGVLILAAMFGGKK